MRVPQNKIITNQTTSGGEYMAKATQQEYVGSYYIIGDQYFAGATFSEKALELVPIKTTSLNPLLAQASTTVYGQLTSQKSLSSLLSTVKISDYRFLPTSDDVQNGFVIRYFCCQVNITPTSIKEISKDTYDQLTGNSLYNVLPLNYYFVTHDTVMGNFQPADLSKANIQMPGLSTYLASQGKIS